MKVLRLGIVVAGCVVGAFAILYATSYDSTPVTKENTFGINALIVHSPVYMGCPTSDCRHPDHFLKITSRSGTFLLGYNICDGPLCVKQDGVAISLPGSSSIPPEYQHVPLPDNLSWKDGDLVSIQVKVPALPMPASMPFDSATSQKIWVDLGKSEIVRSS